jgi:hypothetical protein
MKGRDSRPMPDFSKPGDGKSPYVTPDRNGDDFGYPKKSRLASKSNKQLKKRIETRTAKGKKADKAKTELKSRKRFSKRPTRVRRISK